MPLCPRCRAPLPYLPVQCPNCGKAVGETDAIIPGRRQPGATSAGAHLMTGAIVVLLVLGGVIALIVVAAGHKSPAPTFGRHGSLSFADTLVLGGLILSVIGGLWLLMIAFTTSMGWGCACLILPFASLFFVISHWDEAKKPFLISLLGFVVAVVGTAMGGVA